MNARRRKYARTAALAAAILLGLLAASCAALGPAVGGEGLGSGAGGSAGKGSAGFPLAAMGDSFGREGLSDFAKDNLESFETFVLSNGIPVIVKESGSSRVRHLSLVIRGGSAAASPLTAGYEALALKTMARGSASYDYEAIRSLLDETSSSMGGSSDFDASYYSLNTLDKYFDRLLPLWIDTITKPSFAQADFEKELSNAVLSLQAKEKDPWSKTGLSMNDLFFAGHPYAASPDGNSASLAAASLDAIKAWYAARIRSHALFVVAVGAYDAASLRASLEKGLGVIPSGGELPAEVPAIAGSGPGSLTKVEFPQSKGVGYLRGDFPAPPLDDPEYVDLSIGMSMFSDLLFHVVRDKYGAVYSPMATVRSFNANYGTVALYKTSVPGKAKAYIDEAAAVLASGRGMALDPGSSADGYAPIAEILDSIKAQFVNSTYESQATNAAIASQIARSVLSTGDYRYYLLLVGRIGAVTPEGIDSALGKYLFGGKLTWVARGAADVVADAKAEDFASFNVVAK